MKKNSSIRIDIIKKTFNAKINVKCGEYNNDMKLF